jgi:hypothetical protein
MYQVQFEKVLNQIKYIGYYNKFPAYSKTIDKFKKIKNTNFKKTISVLDFNNIVYFIETFEIIST